MVSVRVPVLQNMTEIRRRHNPILPSTSHSRLIIRISKFLLHKLLLASTREWIAEMHGL